MQHKVIKLKLTGWSRWF